MYTLRFILAAAASLATLTISAQQNQLTDVQITGHVYEPLRLSPTDARIASLQVPAGFTVQRFAEGLNNPRIIDVADDGTVYVTQREPGNLVMMRDLDGDGIVDIQRVVLRRPQLHGILIDGRDIYLTTIQTIYRGTLGADGSVNNLRVHVRNLPEGGQHPNRTLGKSPEGELFVSVGSTCNECREPNPEHATLLRIKGESFGPRSNREIFASGLRNTIGFGWHPTSGALYGLDHGIDWLGDDEQSEELNQITGDARYGWPYVYDEDQFNPHVEPLRTSLEAWAEMSEEPVGLYTAHSAPMQMDFYTGSQFPAEFRNDAFVAMRGSWNRKPPSGYEVVRVRFNSAGEFEAFEPFVTGFLQPQPDGSFGFFARPVGLKQASDGSLLVGDDTNNVIYRVAHNASKLGTPAPQLLASEILEAKLADPISLSSKAFATNGAIPEKYTDYGAGVSPALSWRNVPAGTKSFVVMMEDPAAVSPLPFVHWTLVNLPARLRGIHEGVAPQVFPWRSSSVKQGANSRSETGYFGPRPPVGGPAHRYHFQIFALDTTLHLPTGFNRRTLLRAMEGHVLAEGVLVGTFARPD